MLTKFPSMVFFYHTKHILSLLTPNDFNFLAMQSFHYECKNTGLHFVNSNLSTKFHSRFSVIIQNTYWLASSWCLKYHVSRIWYIPILSRFFPTEYNLVNLNWNVISKILREMNIYTEMTATELIKCSNIQFNWFHLSFRDKIEFLLVFD